MVAFHGTYQDGYVKLDKEISSEKMAKVIVTFLEDVKITSDKSFPLSKFSFAESRKNLENFTGSLSDTVIEERRLEQ